jgi:hypothetical protein
MTSAMRNKKSSKSVQPLSTGLASKHDSGEANRNTLLPSGGEPSSGLGSAPRLQKLNDFFHAGREVIQPDGATPRNPNLTKPNLASVLRLADGSKPATLAIPRWIFDPKSAPPHALAFVKTLGQVFLEYDDKMPSTQRIVFDYLDDQTRAEKTERLKKARAQSRLLCFDLTGQMLFGGSWLSDPASMADEFRLKQIAEAINIGAALPWDGREKDPDFVQRAFRESRNWHERKRSMRFPGGVQIDIARLWTHPLLPLWMMNNEAGSRAIGIISGDLAEVQVNNYAQIIKRAELLRFGGFPITGIITARVDGLPVFKGFEWRGDLKRHLKV